MPGWRTPKQRQKAAQVRFTEKLGQKILDHASENPSPTAIARMIGCGVKSIWWWIFCSSEEQRAHEADTLQRPLKFKIKWPADDPDAEPRWFHELFKLSQKMAGLTMDLENRSEAMFGTKRAVRDPRTNRVLYELDEEAVKFVGHPDPMSAEAREIGIALGYSDFPYLHDENGKRIKVVERVPQPAALKIHTLRSVVPSTYNVSERKEIATTVNGVLQIGEKPKQDSPLRADLEQRLAAIKAAGADRPTAKPHGPVMLGLPRAHPADPVEQITRPNSPEPAEPREQRPLAEHPRAYVQPAPPKPAPPYARPEPLRTKLV